MCLCSYKNEASVAEEDIVCYKLCYVVKSVKAPRLKKILKTDDITGIYRDEFPYRFLEDTTEAVESSFDDRIENASPFASPLKTEYDVHHGFHSYRDLDSAKSLSKSFMLGQRTPAIQRSLILFECKIPKGAKYFEGFANDMHPGFCSERIVLVRALENYYPDSIKTSEDVPHDLRENAPGTEA